MKNVIKWSVIILLTHWWMGCGTPAPEVVVEEKPQAPVIEVDQSNTTCITLADLDPSIRSATEDAFTLYRDQIRFKNYAEARDLWKQAYYTAPGANGTATYHFDDGIKIYDYLFSQATDTDIKRGLVDTILSIYDKRVECFPDDGTMMARKAFNMYYKYSDFVDADETYRLFQETVDKKGDKSDYFIVNPFSRMTYDRLLDSTITQEEGQKYVGKIFSIIDYGKANCEEKYCEAWEVIDEYAPALLSGLEGYRGFYDCDYYMKKYYPQFEENPTDCDNITEVYLKMVWAGCDPSDPRFQTIKAAKDKECYVEPAEPGPLKQGRDALEAGQFKEAITHFETYINQTDDPERKAKYSLFISKIYYAHIKNFPRARKYALQAAEYKPNWGDPYILIGKLYASSGPLCGPGRGWDSQIVTWPAIDKFEYAKKIDPSVTDEANKWIATYRKFMPKKEDIFLRQIKVGSSFKVPCWIQENTRVRTSD